MEKFNTQRHRLGLCKNPYKKLIFMILHPYRRSLPYPENGGKKLKKGTFYVAERIFYVAERIFYVRGVFWGALFKHPTEGLPCRILFILFNKGQPPIKRGCPTLLYNL